MKKVNTSTPAMGCQKHNVTSHGKTHVKMDYLSGYIKNSAGKVFYVSDVYIVVSLNQVLLLYSFSGIRIQVYHIEPQCTV